MPDIVLKFSEEHEPKSQDEKSKLFDEEIERFSQFMTNIGDWRAAGPLNSRERILLKTFLVQKYTGKFDNPSSPEGL